MQIAIKGVYAKHKKLKCGVVSTYWYHRATNTRLPDDPDSDEFFLTVSRLNKGSDAAKTAEGTVAHLVDRYLGSGLFSSKSKGTQGEYKRHCETIKASGIGSYPVADIQRKHVSQILDTHKETAAKADALRRMFSILWSYAVSELGIIEVNNLLCMDSRKSTKPADEGQRPLEEHEIAAVRASNPPGTRRRLIFESELGTAMRRSDVARIPAGAFRTGRITLLTKKTGAMVVAAPTEQMMEAYNAYVAAEEVAGRPVARYVMRGRDDAPLHERTVAAEIEKAFSNAKLDKGLSTHALRYTAAVRLFELGYGYEDIAELCGHEMAAMAKKYTAKKRRARSRASEYDRIDAAE